MPGPTPTPTPGPVGGPSPGPVGGPAPTPHPGQPGTGTQPGQGAGNFAVQLNVKYIRQEELKTMTFEYHSSEAEQRNYAPQGFFGLLLEDLKRKDHFIEVDLDDPFFRVFSVVATAPFDFNRIGLSSASVALDYGDSGDPEHEKHTDIVFEGEDNTGKTWEVFMSDLETSYKQAVEYTFDPDSDWKGESFQYELPPEETEDRTLVLNPHKHLGFLDVTVQPNRMDPRGDRLDRRPLQLREPDRLEARAGPRPTARFGPPAGQAEGQRPDRTRLHLPARPPPQGRHHQGDRAAKPGGDLDPRRRSLRGCDRPRADPATDRARSAPSTSISSTTIPTTSTPGASGSSSTGTRSSRSTSTSP